MQDWNMETNRPEIAYWIDVKNGSGVSLEVSLEDKDGHVIFKHDGHKLPYYQHEHFLLDEKVPYTDEFLILYLNVLFSFC